MTAKPKLDEDGIPDYTKPAFLRRIQIRGYKSIQFCDVQLHPLTILIGRNGSGKSNFLDALGFLADLMEYRVSEAVEKRNGWRAIQCQNGDSKDVIFEIETVFQSGNVSWQGEYTFTLTIGSDNQLRVRDESLLLKDGYREIGYRCQEKDISWRGEQYFRAEPNLFSQHEESEKLENPQLFRRKRYDRLLLSIIGTQPFLDLGGQLRASSVYCFLPPEIRKHQPMSTGPILRYNGSNLARAIEGLKELEPETVERIKGYLGVIVPSLTDFKLQPYGDYETLRFTFRNGRDEIREFDASSISDGTLRVLAGLVAVFQIYLPYGYPGFIGIEEPETALHPAALRALVDALDDATQRTQIFLTTHSPDLLEDPNIKPEQVLVVRNVDGFTRITPMNQASQQIVHKELSSLADLQRIDQLDLNILDLRRQDLLQKGVD